MLVAEKVSLNSKVSGNSFFEDIYNGEGLYKEIRNKTSKNSRICTTDECLLFKLEPFKN